MIYCFFEQSGTFKNAFISLGFKAYDYDISDMFNETDLILDLFREIQNGYSYVPSIFDSITSEDLILAFFPCTRFTDLAAMLLSCNRHGFENKTDLEKLNYSMVIHDELAVNYNILCKLIITCLNRNIKLIIENPFSNWHYLRHYFPIKPKVIIPDRRELGDSFKKPTQFFFFNLEPKDNLIFEPLTYKETKKICNLHGFARSKIDLEFADRFIRRYIIDEHGKL